YIGSVNFFFFQAEDGIRDFHVTGVLTCALPISLRFSKPVLDLVDHYHHHAAQLRTYKDPGKRPYYRYAYRRSRCHRFGFSDPGRSEERGVGKEGRYRGSKHP